MRNDFISFVTSRSAAKELCSCKFGLLSAAVESVLTVVKQHRKFPNHDLRYNQYGCRAALKRERMFITGHGIALVNLKKNANQYS